MLAGVLLGLAAGIIYYPLFLLPLWCSFYWRRGGVRFRPAGGAGAGRRWVSSLALILRTPGRSWPKCSRCSACGKKIPLNVAPSACWRVLRPNYRIPVIALLAICLSLALWPAQKNLGTLLSCSARECWPPSLGTPTRRA